MKSKRDSIAVPQDRALTEPPLVTVVMCVYNAGEYLRPSLLSIIGQTYQNLDILIIDDGSTDGCFSFVEDLLTDHRVRVFHQANSTKPVALNRALDEIRGEFYAIQDADDISHSERIEKQIHAMVNLPELGAVFCGNELIIDGRSVAPLFAYKAEADCKRELDAFRMPAHDPTGMFRMRLVGHLRYDPSLQVAETFDYILRIGEQCPMIVLGECLYGYRILPGSLTRRDPAWREQFVVKALKRACDRRSLEYARVFPDGPRGHQPSRNSMSDNNIAAYFINSVLDQRRANHRAGAIKTGWECVRLHPLDPHYYKALIYALVSPRIVDYLRGEFRSSFSKATNNC
jgi:glycosyltransferase involved in cell wall biosynthesis